MNEIRAFVGHSFSEEDIEVVRKFLKYFSEVSALYPAFTWHNAEDAEPRLLSAKVLSLISECNAFIGICTRKEYAIFPRVLTAGGWSRAYYKGRNTDFIWKTSDWIIQEIGLAKGRDLPLVLLVERDVRPPGELQGDVEYIPFDRENPERAFGKILEMIRGLSPKAPRAVVVSPDTRSTRMPSDSEARPGQVDGDSSEIPKPEWGLREYRVALYRMVMRGDAKGAAAIDQAYKRTPRCVNS
jgi:hypothetical protein